MKKLVVSYLFLQLTTVVADSPAELAAHTFEGHTPNSEQWEVVNKNTVSAKHFKDPTVWQAGTVDSWQDCQTMCAANTTCSSFAYADKKSMPKKHCGTAGICFFRADLIWETDALNACNFTAGRKTSRFPTPPPTPAPTPMPPPRPPLGYQPNLVFILTDDQDTRLGQEDYTDVGSLEAMPKLQEHLMAGGARMRNAFVNTPICCPSRTEFFSGRYYHNIGPPNDPGSCMHVDTTNVGKNTTGLFGLLKQASYEVGVFGKVTNDASTVLKLMSEQESASWINSPLNYNNFMGTTYYRDNGTNAPYTENLDAKNPVYGTAYQSTQIGNRTLEWLDALHARRERAAAAGDAAGAAQPFFAYLGPHAPHYPAQPAPWYEHAFDDVTIPLTPNYNLSCADKTQHIRQNPPLSEQAHCWQNQHFRDRWASLLSVDDIVDAVVAKLEEQGVLDKTFIFYSSDHGYKQGQWRVGTSKQHPYETDIHVPFLVRGPGVKANTTHDDIVGNVDLTPTLLSLAGVTPPPFMDGHSILPLLGLPNPEPAPGARPQRRQKGKAAWRTEFLNEYYSVGTYYNDHSSAWQDGKNTTNRCGGGMPRGPGGDSSKVKKCTESDSVSGGDCYFVDSTHSNSWRALRIIDPAAQRDWQYVEYDPAWEWKTTGTYKGLQHYELYDIAKDPYQMTNVYNATDDATKAELHTRIAAYYACGGAPSSCA
eukprot:g3799.t1